MKSDKTMVELSEAFLELASRKPIEQITISEIAQACGKSRKTFYYHFPDIDTLILWVFRHDLGELLMENYRSQELVFKKQTGLGELPPTERFPFYVHVPSGIRMLDHSLFFCLLGRTFDTRRSLYQKLLKRSRLISEYLYELYHPEIMKDMSFMLGNRYLKPSLVEALAGCFTTAFVANMTRWAVNPDCKSVEDEAAGFENFLHRTMSHEIEEQRLSRKL